MGDPNTGEIYQLAEGQEPKPGDVALTYEQAARLRGLQQEQRIELLREMAASSAKTPLEITDDLTTIKTVISEMVSALSSDKAKRSRERSLVITKLQEAGMWVREAQARE